jgi:hypothetical protein
MKKNIILLVIFLVLGLLIFYNTQVVIDFAGKYIYPLDDAYIHLSMAKTLLNLERGVSRNMNFPLPRHHHCSLFC